MHINSNPDTKKGTTIMSEEIKKTDEQLTPQDSAANEPVKLTKSELETVSGGFLDAHGDVCIGLGAMATITTGGTKN